MTRQAGLSFLEVLIVSVIVGTVLVATSTAMGSSVRAKDALAGGPLEAGRLARDLHTIALALPDGEPTTVQARSYADLVVRQDLDGAVFSPPIDATGAQVASLPDWTQIARLERLDLTDLASPSDAPAGGADAWPALDRLTVTIFEHEREMARYETWIAP